MLRKVLQKINGDSFLKNNITFFISSLLVAFLNYLYYPIISRIMSVEQFGEVQTIFSFVFLSGVILTVFRMLILDLAKNSPDVGISKDSASTLFTLSLALHLPLLLILVFGSPFISRFFSFETSWSFALFSLLLLISIPHTFYNSYVHGKNNFNTLSVSNILSSISKILISAALILLGFQVFGAIGGLILSSLISLIYIKLMASEFHLNIQKDTKIMSKIIKKELPYATLILISLGFVTFLYSGDVLVIKYLFSPEVAGMYGGIATIARSIFFVTASISAVLISSVNVNNSNAENKRIFIKGLTLVALIGGATALFFSLFPNFVTTLLIGSKYSPSSDLLPLLSVLLFLISILNLFIFYFLALRLSILFSASLVSSFVLILLVTFNNYSPTSIVVDFILATVLALVILSYKIFK